MTDFWLMMRLNFKLLPSFQSKKLFVINDIFEPLLSILLLLFLTVGIVRTRVVDSAMLFALVGVAMRSTATFSLLYVTDQNLQIAEFVAHENPWQRAYWLAKFAVSALVGLLQGVLTFGILLILFGYSVHLPAMLGLMVPMALLGSVIGWTSAVLAFGKGNPYFYSNLILAVTPILSGAIVPVVTYPIWLQPVAYALPFANLLNGGLFWLINVLLWFLVGVFGYRYRLKRILQQ